MWLSLRYDIEDKLTQFADLCKRLFLFIERKVKYVFGKLIFMILIGGVYDII